MAPGTTGMMRASQGVHPARVRSGRGLSGGAARQGGTSPGPFRRVPESGQQKGAAGAVPPPGTEPCLQLLGLCMLICAPQAAGGSGRAAGGSEANAAHRAAGSSHPVGAPDANGGPRASHPGWAQEKHGPHRREPLQRGQRGCRAPGGKSARWLLVGPQDHIPDCGGRPVPNPGNQPHFQGRRGGHRRRRGTGGRSGPQPLAPRRA